MSDYKDSDYNFNSGDLVTYIVNRKNPLLIIVTVSLVVSTIVSFLIEEKFSSTVILYPTSSASISNSLLSSTLAEKEILKFGEEEEVEQLLQILNSSEIRDRIIAKYNLMEQYGISPSDKYPKTKLYKEFENNITFERTEFMSVKIEVLDKDPVVASQIADDIANLLDSTINRMQNDRAMKSLLIVEHEYNDLKKRVDAMRDSIKSIRELGVINYEAQSEVFNDAYANAIAMGKSQGAKELEQKLKILAEYGGIYVSLRDQLIYETEKLSILESKYREAKVDAENNLPHKYIVNNAEVSERKAYPIRWLIILISTMGGFVIALLSLLVLDIVKKKN